MDPGGKRKPAACNLCKALSLEEKLYFKPMINSYSLFKESFCHMNNHWEQKTFAQGGILKKVFNDVIYSTVYPKNASFDISVYDSQIKALERRKYKK